MRLLHYSKQPLEQIVSRRQKLNVKPKGLWVSVEGPDDWDEWCRKEDFRNHDAFYIYEVELAKGADLLHLTTADEIDRFTRKYATNTIYGAPLSGMRFTYDVNWPRLARSWDGIIIAPYCWERRLTDHTHWYYGWDCASGCIWRRHAVKRLIEVRPPITPVEPVEAIKSPAIYTDTVVGF